MKLYIENINTYNLDNLEPYKRSKNVSTILYSDEGIFTATNNTLKKHIITDYDIEKYTYLDKTYYIDKSIVKYQNVNKIPFNHKSFIKNIVTYSIEPTSKLNLIIEFINDKIVDVYFDTKQDIRNPIIINDITTLLSYLN
jgi:hypothetical protein|tara:strand:- start:1504 stop:1923 length:420 start_codon:yes stop_codon:yes gene_type:complete